MPGQLQEIQKGNLLPRQGSLEVYRETVADVAGANICHRDLKRSGVYTIGGRQLPRSSYDSIRQQVV